MKKIACGVIGATGMVGQNYIRLLDNHPWFDIRYVAASLRSAGKRYEDAVNDRWHMDTDIPENVRGMIIEDAGDVEKAKGQCRFVFSAVNMTKDDTRELENSYAKNDLPVVSNNSAHRHMEDVPILIPEINADHIDIIPMQRNNRGWERGFIVVKPNCSVQSYLIPVHALIKAGYEIKDMIVTTLQGLSGGGYPGPSSLDMVDNIIPFIRGEEEKSEKEPLKILGRVKGSGIKDMDSMKISAHCTRVPVIDGHTACVSILFGDNKPGLDEILEIWDRYRSIPQDLNLPSAPPEPIIYRPEIDRPQPRKDRTAGRGMAIIMGRLRECNVFDYRFVGLSHNTIRGAAGGGILNAELLKVKGFFN
ncbi:aspartate-semialdehyde dehydrogenase [Thermodesulfobacteriota bacterium]